MDPNRRSGAVARQLPTTGFRGEIRRGMWTAFGGVLVLALPLLSLFPFGVAIKSSDSAVVVNTATFVATIDNAWLLKSQEPPLLQVVYGPWLEMLHDTQPLVVVPLLSTALLAAVTAALSARITRSALGGLFAGLLLLAMSVTVPQSRLLPLYAGFIAFGLLGVWAALRFVREEHASRWLALSASLWSVLAVMAHGAGLYFATLVVATILFVRGRRSLRRYGELAGMMLITFLPWIVAHLWVGGFNRFLSPRTTWIVSRGYLTRVTLEFWHRAVDAPVDIVLLLPVQLLQALGWVAWLVFPLGLIGLTRLPRRAQIFSIVAAVGLVAPMILYQTSVFARYFYPLLPGIAVLAALGFSYGLGWMRRHRIRPVTPFTAGIIVVAVAIVFYVRLADTVAAARQEAHSAERSDLTKVASLVDDGRAVIAYRRSTVLMLVAPDVFVYYADLLSEEEFVAYLTWRRDKIRQLLHRRDIGWALVREPAESEARYNATWLKPAYGVKPTYTKKLKKDPMSCLIYDGPRYRLYKLHPTVEDDGVGSCG